MRSKLLLMIIIASVLTLSAVMSACQAAAPGEQVTLKLVSFFPNRPPQNMHVINLVDEVNKNGKGELVIEFVGGPEIIAPPEAAPAVQRGTFDIGFCLQSLTDAVVPGIRCLSHSELTQKEFRKSEAVDYIQELCNKAGLFYWGQSVSEKAQDYLYIYTNKPVRKVDDFAGLKIGTPSPSYNPFLGALKTTPVIVPFADYFTAVERGTIDGYTFSNEDVPAYSLQEVTKYCIDHSFGTSPNVYIVNLGVWNKLPKKLQDVMVDSMSKFENDFPAIYYREMKNPAREKMKQAGMEFIKFSPDEAKKYYETYKNATWGAELKAHPDIAPKLKELLTK